jgi:hypothetical protein
LNFDVLKKKLDTLDADGDFKGFSPRWMLPTRLRNITNPEIYTSNLLIIIDSAREADRGLGEHFSTEIIGDNEIMVSSYALRHLNVTSNRKEKVELYFDIIGLLNLFASSSGQSSGGSNGGLDALQALLPSPKEIIAIMKD